MADAVIKIGDVKVAVTLRGAAGPRGLPSGALGAGSVTEDTISDDSGEQVAIREKLGAADAATVDGLVADVAEIIDVTVPAAATARAALTPASWPPPRVLRWDGYFANSIPREVTLVGEPDVSIDTDGYLSVYAPWNSGDTVLLDAWFGEGLLEFEFAGDADNGWMVRQSAPNASGKALWFDGTTLRFGFLDPSNSYTVYGSTTSIPTGPVRKVELASVVQQSGAYWQVRMWDADDPRPTTPTLDDTYDSEVLGQQVNDGRLRLSSMGGEPAKFGPILIRDGRGGGAQAVQVDLVGSWYPAFDAGIHTMKTLTGGDEARFIVEGAEGVVCRYTGVYGDTGGHYPMVDIYVNEVLYRAAVEFTGAEAPLELKSIASASFIDGLDPAQPSRVRVVVRDVPTDQARWLYGYGLALQSFVPVDGDDAPSGTIIPWKNEGPACVFIGDSTTAGIKARSPYSPYPVDSAGDLAWTKIFARAKGLHPIIRGFPGTGILTAYADVPKTIDNALNYMQARPIDTAAQNVKFGMMMVGINDFIASVTTGNFQAAYILALRLWLLEYPGLQKFACLCSLSGRYKVQIQNAIAAVGDPRIVFIDTTGWSDVTCSDSPDFLHYDIAGHAAFAAHLIEEFDTLGGVVV